MIRNITRNLLSVAFGLLSLNASAQTYDSQNISLHGNWNDSTIVAEPFYGIRYNGIWGWADGLGREYALIGATNGVHVVDVTNPTNPVRVDFVPGRRSGCIWREIKTYQNYAYLISDDNSPNSFQIIDLQYLPDSVSVVYDSDSLFERAHTLYVDGDRLYCGIVKGGVISGQSSMSVFSLSNPVNPSFLRDLDSDFPGLLANQQVHDMLVKNDTVYASCAFDGLFIFRYNPVANNHSLLGSITLYPQQGYNHSSALTADGNTLVFMDEVPTGLACKVMDVSDFSNLTITSTFQSNVGPTPHNPFMVDNTCYIAYYQDGLQVYDVSNPALPVRVGYFDTQYQTPMGGPYTGQSYSGAWGAYPYLPSGNVLVSDMQNGLYVLDVSQITTALNEVKDAQRLRIWPNPAESNGLVQIQLPEGVKGTFNYRLSDLSGRLMAAGSFSGARFEVNTDELSSGMYTINVENQDGLRLIEKLMVR
jgi:choice-of-anchor B domain-containing protein